MPVTAALTNYNAKHHVRRLIPQLTSHGFDHIIVLDDASTDDSLEYLAHGLPITLIRGEKNLGPTGNRNRMLDLDARDIILFIDADIDLTESSTAAAVEREFTEHPNVGAIGPLITSRDGRIESRCWGYDFTPFKTGVMNTLYEVARRHQGDPRVMNTIRELSSGRVAFFEPVVSRNVEWVREGFFAVRTSIFRDLGGFDPKFRMFHEGPDLCLRIRQAGWDVRFTIDICVRHFDLRSRTSEERVEFERESDLYYFEKHYGISAEQFAMLMR